MTKFILRYVIIGMFGCIHWVSGQSDASGLGKVPKEITLQELEDRLIDEAFEWFNNKEYDRAYKRAHELRKSLKTEKAASNSLLLLAYHFRNQTLIDSSNFYVKEALKYNHIGTDSTKAKFRSTAYSILGTNYKNQGLFEESRKWHLKGIEEAQKYNEENLYYTNSHGLALNYSEAGEYGKALELFKECITYEDDEEIVFGSYINIGMIYSGLEDYETAEKYLQKGRELSQQKNNQSALAVILLNQGVNAQTQGHHDLAIELYEETVEVSSKINLRRIELIGRMNIGSVFSEMGNNKDAELIYSLALYHAREMGLFDQQLNILDNLKEIAIDQGNYKNALHHLSKYFEVKDSIVKLQKVKEINELEVRYETLKKEKEIKILKIQNSNRDLKVKNQQEAIKNLKLEQEIEKKETENQILAFENASEKRVNEINLLKKNQELQELNLARQKTIKNIILYSFLIILVPIIGLLAIYYQKLQAQSELNVKEKEVNQQKITSLLKDQELEVIKASVEGQDKERKRIAQELHDSIGGNLAAIKLQLNSPQVKNKSYMNGINHQIDETYQQVRSLSHNLIPKKFKKNNFCDVIEEYLSKISNASNIALSIAVYPRKEIDYLSEKLHVEIFKIIQELITNTIKHAQASQVELHINLGENNDLNIIFEDNGIGFNTEKQKNGLGFLSIKSRLKDISGILYIDSRPNRGTVINIEIQTQPSQKKQEQKLVNP